MDSGHVECPRCTDPVTPEELERNGGMCDECARRADALLRDVKKAQPTDEDKDER